METGGRRGRGEREGGDLTNEAWRARAAQLSTEDEEEEEEKEGKRRKEEKDGENVGDIHDTSSLSSERGRCDGIEGGLLDRRARGGESLLRNAQI